MNPRHILPFIFLAVLSFAFTVAKAETNLPPTEITNVPKPITVTNVMLTNAPMAVGTNWSIFFFDEHLVFDQWLFDQLLRQAEPDQHQQPAHADELGIFSVATTPQKPWWRRFWDWIF